MKAELMVKPEVEQHDWGEVAFLVMAEHGLERWAIDKILRDGGARVVATVATPADAFDLLKTGPEPFDIVVWDLNSGVSADARSLRQILDREPAPSVIFVSALDPSDVAPYEAAQRALGVRIMGTVERPVTAGKLAPLVALHRASAAARTNPRRSKHK